METGPLERSIAGMWRQADPGLLRTAQTFRATFDQLYDGQRTGRYRWDQLFKTEKTHFGTLLEINLRREFVDFIQDGSVLDFRIAGHQIDCKYSMTDGGWMIPPEAIGELLLVAHAVDAAGWWSLGVIRASEAYLRPGRNRDRKAQLNSAGREAITWIARMADLPPNVLLQLESYEVERIFTNRTGQARVNELLRTVTNQRIGRSAIATVAQQEDYMKRVRANGGARSALRAEGYLVPSGDYVAHRKIAEGLGAVVPRRGEVVSLKVVPAEAFAPRSVMLDGAWWRLAREDESVIEAAPKLPSTKGSPAR